MKKNKKIDYDKIIKGFFDQLGVFLRHEEQVKRLMCGNEHVDLNTLDMQRNITCVSILASNPAKFTKAEEVEKSGLGLFPYGLANGLFDVVNEMIVTVRAYYNNIANGVGTGKEEQHILELAQQATKIMVKKTPLQMGLYLKLSEYHKALNKHKLAQRVR
ncbi:MAG: hypothetical protein KBS86_02745 [Proteobacteria bacterium]|nr:hypothetical protein [Candidatus Enterousia scatequi]